MSIELPPLHADMQRLRSIIPSSGTAIYFRVEAGVEARERILREQLELALGQRDLALARIAEVESQRDYLVEEYERVVAARGEAVDQQFRWRPLGQTEFSDWTSKRAVTDGWVSRARAAGHDVEVRDVFAAPVAPAAAVPAANVTPMRQPRTDLARLVESINAAVYANGDGLSVTEAIGALELAKLELLKEQEQ